jgi:hypothetical protein
MYAPRPMECCDTSCSARPAAITDLPRSPLRLPKLMRAALLPCLLTLAACGQPSEPAQISSTSDTQYNLNLDMKRLMNLVVEPVADTLWDTAGWVLSDAGYEELYPTTDEGWEFVYNQSAMIVELGNILALPGRAQGDTWLRYAQAMSEVGEIAMHATAAQDNEAYFQAGAQLYSVCTACHQAYNTAISRFVNN